MDRFVKIIQKGINKSCKNLINLNDEENMDHLDNENFKNAEGYLSNKDSSKTSDLKDYISSNSKRNVSNNFQKSALKNLENIKIILFNTPDDSTKKLNNTPVKDSKFKDTEKSRSTYKLPITNFNKKLNSIQVPLMDKKPLNFNKNDVVFCQYVDGLKPDITYEALICRFNLISKNHKNLFIYLYPDEEEDLKYPKQLKKENVFINYIDNFRKLDENKYFFISEERDKSTNDNVLKQMYLIANKYNPSYICFSYLGLMEANGKEELKKSLYYLIKYIDTPTIIFKEPIFSNEYDREQKKTKLNWLFVFDMYDSRCYSILSKFIGLVDPNEDFVYGLTLLPSVIKKDDIELNFFNEMKLRKIKNFSYEMVDDKKDHQKLVVRLVNEGEVHFNFVVLYNKIKPNSNLNFKEEKNNPIISIIYNCNSNICISSGL